MAAPSKAVRHLAYTERALLTATGQRRADLLAIAEHLRGQLAGRCVRCGRAIQADESVAAGLGSHCRKAAAS